MTPPAAVCTAHQAVATVAAEAKRRNLRVATAESCTGGMLSAALTESAGASQWFLGGVAAYDDVLKKRLLKVPAALLAAHGSVSEETARAMCDGLFLLGASAAAAITGVAGPGGGTTTKPVGHVCFGFRIGGEEARSQVRQFAGDRAEIRTAATAHALAVFAGMLGRDSASYGA